jgi:hypothetical protein
VGARSDERHRAEQHVEQLGQFIDREFAEEAPKPGNPAVREAAWKVILRMPPTVAATVWATRVVEAAFPGVQLVEPQRRPESSRSAPARKSSTR